MDNGGVQGYFLKFQVLIIWEMFPHPTQKGVVDTLLLHFMRYHLKVDEVNIVTGWWYG